MEVVEEDEEEMETEVTSTAGAALRIKALDRVSASNIRNSQIITKVSDAVRELVENALDADAKKILVYLEKSGLNKIEVRDNGHGIRPEDISVVFQGGHTSKLKDETNLSRGKHYGFKGEALCALCAAGKVTVCTKLVSEPMARKYQLGPTGRIECEGKSTHSGGTNITVMKLFEDIPVRRQRLNNKSTAQKDLQDIETYLKGAAIANPKCHFSLYNDSSMIWSKASVQSTEQALVAVLGFSIAKKMEKCGPFQIICNKDDGDTGSAVESSSSSKHRRSIELFLPKPPVDMRTLSFTSNKLTMILCNRKRVYIREFEKLIHKYITAVVVKPQPADQRRFPVSILNITIPPEEADFNREMDKSKVFLVHKDSIFKALESALKVFYKIDLNDEAQAAKELCNSENAGSSKGVKPTAPDSNRLVTPASVSVLSPCSGIREESIGLFLDELPSFSLAFSNSPKKDNPKDMQPISIEFPVSNPVLALAQRTGGSGTPRMISNFEITIEDDDDITPTPLAINHQEKGKNVEKTGDIPKNPLQNPIIAVPENLAKPFERINANNFENWLEGRMPDRNGGIIENVHTVMNPPENVSNVDNIDSRKFQVIASSTGTPNYNKSDSSNPRPRMIASTPQSVYPIVPPPSKKLKLNCGLFSSIQPSQLESPLANRTNSNRQRPASVNSTLGSQFVQQKMHSFVSRKPTEECSKVQFSIPKEISELRPPALTLYSTSSSSSHSNIISSITTSINGSSPFTPIGNCENKQTNGNDCQQIQTSSLSNDSSSTTDEFYQIRNSWVSSLNFINHLRKFKPQPRFLGKVQTVEGEIEKYVSITQTPDGIGVFCPRVESLNNENENSACLSEVEENTSCSDVRSRWSKFLQQPGCNASKVFQIFITTDKLVEVAEKGLMS